MIGLLLVALLPVAGLIVSAADAPEGLPHFTLSDQALEIGRSNNSARTNPVADNASPAAIYRLSGEKSLRPVRIGDDGTHMYLEWSEEQALPAVFALNAIGEEEMVDGYMRAGIFTIDRVHQALVFRIGKKRAHAKRMNN